MTTTPVNIHHAKNTQELKAGSSKLKAFNVTLAACSLMLVACSLTHEQGATSQPMILKFILLDGHAVDVSSLKGKILIDCWATWCILRLKEMMHIKELYEKYNGNSFEVIGISMDEASAKERVQQIIAQKDLSWPQCFQGSGFQEDTFRKLYQIKSFPAVFLLDREGNIVTPMRGRSPGTYAKKYLGL